MQGRLRVVALLALAVLVGFFLSVKIAGATVQCPPGPNSTEAINVAPIPFEALKDLVEKNGAVFQDGAAIFFLTLAGEQALTIEIPTTNEGTPKVIKGVFALVQGTENGGPLTELQCFFVGVIIPKE